MNFIEWLKRLIALDTTSRNTNLQLIHCVQEWFADYSIESWLTKDPVQPKANVFATLPAGDGRVQGGLIFSGHTDVVPVDGQDWESDPFVASLINERIYGRGACDMKGFIAVALSLIPRFKEMKLPYPLHFAFSYDEEVGCLGAPRMIDEIKAREINPLACIVGEPTSMRPVIGHKGKQSFRCSVHGVAAHSSLTTQGCNAIEYAAEIICFIRKMADKYRQFGIQDKDFDVPFTTLTTNLIQGGNSYNTIPELCEFIFEFRNLPADKAEGIRQRIFAYVENDLLPRMQKEHCEANVILDTIAAAPGLDTPESTSLVQQVAGLRKEQERLKVAYATEAGLFQEALIPTIICGPGSIEQAHRANEYVDLSQLKQCELFLQQIVAFDFKGNY